MLNVVRSLGNVLKASGKTEFSAAQLQHVTAKQNVRREVGKVGSKLQAGDRVLLSWIRNKRPQSKLTKPLKEDGLTVIDNHDIQHCHLIGQHENTVLEHSMKGGLRHVRVSARHPSLDEFTSLAPRRVAPIYASYADSIVSLLDIHVEPPIATNEPGLLGGPYLQILEAGTGHGSLTLHLARAIAAANPPPPASTGTDSDEAAWQEWRAQRRAILHTMDVDEKNTLHAENLIRSYRSALYWPHVDFHHSNIKDWLCSSSAPTSGFDVVVLDMPGIDQYMADAAGALKNGGVLLTFVPQITQVAACIEAVRQSGLPLAMSRVLELGDGVSTGRNWDVRMANIRQKPAPISEPGDSAESVDPDAGDDSPPVAPNRIPPMVCRPMVGELTRGGGFIAKWQKPAST